MVEISVSHSAGRCEQGHITDLHTPAVQVVVCVLQKFVQTVLVGAAGICMPWLLITKPVVIGIQRALSKRSVSIHLRDHNNTMGNCFLLQLFYETDIETEN